MPTIVDMGAMPTYFCTVTADRLLLARSLPRLGEAIRQLRTERDLTQAELADRAGVSRVWIGYVEQGTSKNVSMRLVMRVLDELDASLMVRDDHEDS